MKYFRITQVIERQSPCPVCLGSRPIPGKGYIADAKTMADFVDAEINGDVGDKYMVEVVEMSEQEFSGLPEFTGF